VQGVGHRVQVAGFRAQGSGFRIKGCRAQGSGFRVSSAVGSCNLRPCIDLITLERGPGESENQRISSGEP